MTIKKYWDNNSLGKRHLLEFEFAEEFSCWIYDGKVYMEEYSEGEYELVHIKTIRDYQKLHKLLTWHKLVI